MPRIIYIYFLVLVSLISCSSVLLRADTLVEPISLVFSTMFGKQDKEFVIVIPSYNNKNWYQLNLASVLSQEYKNYRIIYIDDASTDGTADLVEAYVRDHPQRERFTLIRNKERLGALINRFLAFHMIPDHAIICELDGDDWYAHSKVLAHLNEVYRDPQVWLTFGQFKRVPNNTIGHSHPIAPVVLENNVYRVDGYYTSMLRTYYAWLYKRIHLQDLLFLGKPFSTGTDIAIMYPMVEMAGEHARYIDEILYIVNRYNSLNTELVIPQEERDMNDRVIRQYKKRYKRLDSVTQPCSVPRVPTVGALIYSDNTPEALSHTLASFAQYARDLALVVVYHAQGSTCSYYAQLKEKHPNIIFMEHTEGAELKELLHCALKKLDTDYVLMGADERVLTLPLHLDHAIDAMRVTHAHGFYFVPARNPWRPYAERKLMPPFITLSKMDAHEEIYAWQLCGGAAQWMFPRNVDMVLYKTATIHKVLDLMCFDTLCVLRYLWARMIDLDSIALCYGNSPIAQNPLIVERPDVFDPYDCYYGDPYRTFMRMSFAYLFEKLKFSVKINWSRLALGALCGSAAALALQHKL